MPTLTLLAKVYNSFQTRTAEKLLKSALKDLRVEAKTCGVTSRGWIQIEVSGEDEQVALNFLTEEIGVCPISLEHVKKFSTIKGCISVIDRREDKLYVDIGVFSPKIVDATIPLHLLQAQLVDGRKLALKKIAELFGLCKNLPLTVKILNINIEKNLVEAMVSESQLALYQDWTMSLLDRLIILGASAYEVRLTLKRMGLNRDILSVEPLGLFEHAATCKLGTDAEGLIPKIGKSLRNSTLQVFSPRRGLETLIFSLFRN